MSLNQPLDSQESSIIGGKCFKC